jgi:hypothetical protein
MGGPPFNDSFGHGPSSFGGTYDDLPHNMSKLDINDKRDKIGIPQKRRVSFKTTPMHYEYYTFTKGASWKVANPAKISAPQAELEKKVSKGGKSSTVLDLMLKMSPDRRNQIEWLVDQKNKAEGSNGAWWSCVYIHTPKNPKAREINGKMVLECKKMDIIIARPARSASQNEHQSFVGEKSVVGESLRFSDKNKPANGGKDAPKQREDPFDRNSLFPETALEDNHEHLPRHQPFNQGMGQPFGPASAQPVGPFAPTGPAHPSGPGHHQNFGSFSNPGLVHQLPAGVRILDDLSPQHDDIYNLGALPFSHGQMHHPPQNGGDGIYQVEDPLIAQGQMHHHNRQPQFHQGQLQDFGAGPGHHRNRPNEPVIIQHVPHGRRHHSIKPMYDETSSRDSDNESVIFDDYDELSSSTSHGDDYETLKPRGSLVPHHRRHSSVKRREPTYREHHRGPSYPVEPPTPRRRIEHAPPRESRYSYHSGVETTVARPSRRHSTREPPPHHPKPHHHQSPQRESIRYREPARRRLEYPNHHHSPPLRPVTPLSHSPSPPAHRSPGLLYPHELDISHDRDRDREREREDRDRSYNDILHERVLQERLETVRRKERQLHDRELLDAELVREARVRQLQDQELLLREAREREARRLSSNARYW